jgi:co-chaperonin GroES (HSP10)
MLKPLKNNVIIELIEKEKVTQSGIVLASADPHEANKAKVIAVGSDVTDVVEGDIILPNWNAAKKSKFDDNEFYVIDAEEIVGVFEESEVDGE